MSLTHQVAIDYNGVSDDDIDATDMYIFGSCDCLDEEGVQIPDCVDEAYTSLTECINNGGTWVEGTDTSLWAYDLTVPAGTINNGPVSVSITGIDQATNPLDSDPESENFGQTYLNDAQLEVDNTVAVATFTYENLSNPDLLDYGQNPTTIMGAGGDNIRITITMNEPMSPQDPVPSLNGVFGDGNGTEITGLAYTSVDLDSEGNPDNGIDNDHYIFELTLPDAFNLVDGDTIRIDDGLAAFQFIAKDRANNYVTSHVDSNVFSVDNIHPAVPTGLMATISSRRMDNFYC